MASIRGLVCQCKYAVLFLFSAFLAGCAGLEPAQPPDLNIPSTHLFGVTRLAFSPSGTLIASGGFKGDLAILQVPDGAQIGKFQWHRDAVRGLIWIDKEYLLSAGEEGAIAVTHITSGSLKSKLETHAGLTSLAYLAGTSQIVAGYTDGSLKTFSYPTFQPIHTIQLGAEVVALAVDHMGRRLAVSTEDERVLLFDQKLSEVMALQRPSRRALELRFSPDDSELVAGAWYQVFYWDLVSGKIRVQETEHWGAVTSLDYHPKGDQLITLGRHTDANLRLVDAASGHVQRRLQGHRLCGAAVRFSPDGRYVASGSDDESIRFYDLTKPYLPQRVGDNW
ncbi:WD40 repeat domain-containing protein [Sedimenticola selenatireducens]|uniref:DDB1- and CUL4-associated factor 12 beta-propeller domain-containing protein n=1 Tax=Sedimenticola selenatireducens TaxID=191960 RepID=A0A557SEG1_9GAMM|nr:hypothetical protein [Sedimenticola selenatireducens]TVO75806.1 hypothetical protein FHP88_07335 [Sedimenticola selenatireducens]TVT63665.1 MAG: hypothetical protein FHK78_10035 [Sedimenticola selenatireducens]